ncbi:hypothetical protein PENSPDRAFT_683241 [Peniophora sp. CONT]|nr:hypothetical protein PENSPDRAFT_683241 [Peniophora sp. CONT]
MPSPPRLARCLDLAQLPKNTNRLTNVNIRATTPGSPYPLLYRRPPVQDLLDPSHPAARLHVSDRNKLAPIWHSPHFDLQAFPKAWLVKDENPVPGRGWDYTPYPERRTKDMKQLDMSVVFSRRGDYIGYDKFVWSVVKRKLRTALQLVVTRGARMQDGVQGKDPSKPPLLVYEPADANADRWVQPDWTYVFLPKKELYRTTVNHSVGSVRDALTYILEQAKMREDSKWAMPVNPAKKGANRQNRTRNPRTTHPSRCK